MATTFDGTDATPIPRWLKRVPDLGFEASLRQLAQLTVKPPGRDDVVLPDNDDIDSLLAFIEHEFKTKIQAKMQTALSPQALQRITPDQAKAITAYTAGPPFNLYLVVNGVMMQSRRDEQSVTFVGPFIKLIINGLNNLDIKSNVEASRAVRVQNIPSLLAAFKDPQVLAAGQAANFWGFSSWTTEDAVMADPSFSGGPSEPAIIYKCQEMRCVDINCFSMAPGDEKEVLPIPPAMFTVMSRVAIPGVPRLAVMLKQIEDNSAFQYVAPVAVSGVAVPAVSASPQPSATPAVATNTAVTAPAAPAAPSSSPVNVTSPPPPPPVPQASPATQQPVPQPAPPNNVAPQQQVSGASLLRVPCSKCREPRMVENVFNTQDGTVQEVAVCSNHDCLLQALRSLQVGPAASTPWWDITLTTLPPIPPTATSNAEQPTLPFNGLDIEQVFNTKSGTVVEVAICVGYFCESTWPTPLDVSDNNTATAPLPPIPSTATCVVVTELNERAAAWIATSSRIRTVCVVRSVRVDPDLTPLTHVQRLLFCKAISTTSWGGGWSRDVSPTVLQLDGADRFAATFPNLLELCAQRVAINGTLASLGKCKSLQSLDLQGSHNVLDAGLQHICAITALQSLNLGSCNNISRLQHLRGLSALRSLDLHDCAQVTDAELQHLSGSRTLQSLNLSKCSKITGTGLQHLIGLASFQSLNLAECNSLTDDGLMHLRSLKALESLDLSRCTSFAASLRCLDDCLQHVRGLTALQSLNLSNNKITDAGLRLLSGLIALRSLDLSMCDGLSDAGLGHLRVLTALQSLKLSKNGITDAGLQHVSGLLKMQLLDLNGCENITDAGLQHLRGLTSLQELDLSHCKVTDAGLQHVSGLTKLQRLSLGNYSITDAGLQHLSGLVALRWLKIDCSKITDVGLQHLYGLSELQWLDVTQCSKISHAAVQSLKAAVPRLQNLVGAPPPPSVKSQAFGAVWSAQATTPAAAPAAASSSPVKFTSPPPSAPQAHPATQQPQAVWMK